MSKRVTREWLRGPGHDHRWLQVGRVSYADPQEVRAALRRATGIDIELVGHPFIDPSSGDKHMLMVDHAEKGQRHVGMVEESVAALRRLLSDRSDR